MFFVVSVANERDRICLKKISLEDKCQFSWIKRDLLAICDRIDADKQVQLIEERENELKRREQEIAKREAEIEKREEERLFISVRTDGIYLKNVKIINKNAKTLLFVFKMLLKEQTNAIILMKSLVNLSITSEKCWHDVQQIYCDLFHVQNAGHLSVSKNTPKTIILMKM
ncbi:hypothetical protein FACS189449_05320 [Alphaproteobacteria bacterium]|nr:hypothetical protein FACS189449_05320 [Alphaproteobacteria bacterium]